MTLDQRKEEETLDTILRDGQIMPKEKLERSKLEILDSLSGKASKFLEKNKSIAKQFGNRQSEIKIYTIDKEMAKFNNTQISEDTSNKFEISGPLQNIRNQSMRLKSVGCQASPYPPYRLFFLPADDWKDSDCCMARFFRFLLCESTLACFLLVWLILGALTFYLTESPYEYIKMNEFKMKENTIIMSLATDLRNISDQDKAGALKGIIQKYIRKHKELIDESVINSYGNNGIYWTFAGSITFSISLLATLGLATPLPLTTLGNIEAFIFTLIGVPIHLLLLTHLGRTIALKIQFFSKEIENKFSLLRRRIANLRRFGDNIKREKELWPDKMFEVDFVPSTWLKFFPIVSTLFYYIGGAFLFGLARELNFAKIFFFPLDFARWDPSTSGISRVGYAWYLEGLAILTSINITLWRDSPFSGLTPVGIKYNFMTNSLE
ncbi:TWiK family of potassium channels protein 7-like isoform X2 [Cimex lectularius]|nr:TWiK family of potassium channels protein 7-like isoform X2 [Cimex lectularius]